MLLCWLFIPILFVRPSRAAVPVNTFMLGCRLSQCCGPSGSVTLGGGPSRVLQDVEQQPWPLPSRARSTPVTTTSAHPQLRLTAVQGSIV